MHDGVAGNICYDWVIGDKAVVDNVFAGAAHVVKLDLTNNRLIPNAMEPRVAIGDFDTSSGDFTLYTTSQNPHVIRLLMGAFVLHIPENKLRVVAPDVGGGFGSKIYHYAEEAIVTWAAGKVRRPVKWTCERSESFMSDAHGRDHVSTAEMALDKDGTLPRPAHQHAGEHGRLPVHLRPRGADLPVRHAAGGRLQDAGDLLQREGGVHQHRPGGRLSRRRPAGGHLPAGAPGRRDRPRHRLRQGRTAAEEFHPGRRLPVSDAGGAAVRQRRLSDDPEGRP